MDRDSAKVLFKDHLQYNAALCVNPDLVLQCVYVSTLKGQQFP